MDLSGIISISGKPGLSKIISQSKNGIIVESLIDQKRFPVQGAQRVSSLEDISIYTYEDDVPLISVFESIHKNAKGEAILSHKSSPEEIKDFIKGILPNYDEDRVYQSDLKKIVQWYNLLLEKGLLKSEEKEKEKKEDKPKKKAPAKAAAKKKPTAKKKQSDS